MTNAPQNNIKVLTHISCRHPSAARQAIHKIHSTCKTIFKFTSHVYNVDLQK